MASNPMSDAFNNEQFPGNFYSGLIVFLDRVRGRGLIRSFTGREIPFQFPFVSIVGAPIGRTLAGIELIKEGDSIGFDVGWTSNGLRVTRIKPAASAEQSQL